MKNLGLKSKIIISTSVTLALMVASGIIGHKVQRSLAKSSAWVEHTYKVIASANTLISAAVDMETGMRGYLLAGDESFLDPYKSGKIKFNSEIVELSNTVSDNPAQVALLSEVKTSIADWSSLVAEKQIELRREVGSTKTMADVANFVGEARGKKFFDHFRGQVATFIGREQTLIEERKAEAKSVAVSSNFLIVGSLLVAIVIGAILSIVVANSVVRLFKAIFGGLKRFSSAELDGVKAQFNQVINSLSKGSTQVSSASFRFASSSFEQAAGIEETSSTLEEVASMTNSNAANTKSANELMNNTNSAVSCASKSMDALSLSMEQISKASHETSAIVKTIDEIAFQTNILALNAAVEAARAGEAGSGFAVVADEVRNLAQRSVKAAKNTSDLLSGTVSKVTKGVEAVKKNSDEFEAAAKGTVCAAESIAEISQASE